MPSEAQPQEPRDRGPPPPVTRAGRSAQLAKAAVSSPAPERRPRGRPRKDGSSGRPGPPAPPPPPPPPAPPPPKSRKKGRSRGRAQVEDEESMDATEKKPPQKTEVKEKTTRRQRSTSRRKSKTSSEPAQDQLSPDPDPDPDPGPGPTDPEPAPSAEEEEGEAEDRLESEAPPLASSPLLPPSSPPPQSHHPVPDPVEEDRPSPSHSPTPTDVDYSLIPIEAEEAGPVEQSPAVSSHSSPPVSPCLRSEDEDSLSPLFQRSLSEDSEDSPTPSLGHTKKRLKQCAFCYHGDEPPLGQGRLVVFGPTPGYIPLHILNRRTSSDRDNDCHDHCYRGRQAPPTCCSPEQCESSSEFLKQLGPIGLPHDINVQSLFDPTGQCCAHLQCATWSEGVCRGEGQSLLYVDKAIDSGSTQVCVFCRRLGASLRCQETDCGRCYHFPCAAAAGAHLDWNQRRTLCTRHAGSSPPCALCSGGGELGSLLMCCCCGNRYHGSCVDPSVAPSPFCRAGWQCPRCRVCQSCRLRDDEAALLVCERCDKAYHTHCLTPPLDHTPSTSWSCKNCRVCRRCGVRSSGQWANHPFLCESCDPALPCLLCGHAPDLYTPQDCVTCICCYRFVHADCIIQAGEGKVGSEAYICSTCRPQQDEPNPHSPTLASAPALSSSQTPPSSIPQPSVSTCTEAPPASPVGQLVPEEPPQRTTKSISAPSPPSLTSSHPDPIELQQNPTPSHTDSQELLNNPLSVLPQSTGLRQSSTTSHPEASEPQQSPLPSHPEGMETQQSPPPVLPESTELQQNPPSVLLESTELQGSSVMSHPEAMERLKSPPSDLHESTELQQSSPPVLPESTELQQNSPPVLPESTELQGSSVTSHPDAMERLKSPPSDLPEPAELQQSPPSGLFESTKLQESPETSHPEATELRQISPSDLPESTELQESSVSSQPEATALQQSPPPIIQKSTELQESLLCQPDSAKLPETPKVLPQSEWSMELEQSPSQCQTDPTELQQSPPPSHPNPLAVQQSSSPALTELPPSAELQQSSLPSSPVLKDLQQSPASSPMELQQSSSPTPVEHQQFSASSPKELPDSPAPSHPLSTELQRSPQPSPKELPSQLVSMELQPNSLQMLEELQNPAPSCPDSTELQQNPPPSPKELPPQPISTELQPNSLQMLELRSPAPSENAELQQGHPSSPIEQSSSPPSAELQHILVLSHTDSTELPQNAPSPKELLSSPAQSHTDPLALLKSPAPLTAHTPQSPRPSVMELPQSPVIFHPDPMEPQQNVVPLTAPSIIQFEPSPSCQTASHGNQEELHPDAAHESYSASHLDSTDDQKNWNPLHLQQSPAQSHYNLAELVESTEQNSTEDQLMDTESQQSPVQGGPTAFTLAHSLHSPSAHSPIKSGPTPPRVELRTEEPRRSLPPHSPAQDNAMQLSGSCSQENIVISQPQQSALQMDCSPMPHSPVQVGISRPWNPSQDTESTLDQESPGLSSPTLQYGAAQDTSTLDQDLSSPARYASAPCSPSSPPLRPRRRSLSQPASPAQALRSSQLSLHTLELAAHSTVTQKSTHATQPVSLKHCPLQKSSNPDGQTLENNPPPLNPTSGLATVPPESSTLSPDHSSPPHVPDFQTPESLFHISTSAKHSSLACSPCAGEMEEAPPPASQIHQNPHNTPSLCMEVVEGASPTHIQASPACASSTHAYQMPTSPTMCLEGHPSPVPGESSPSAALAGLIYLVSCQDEEMQVATIQPSNGVQSEHSPSQPDSPQPDLAYSEATGGIILSGHQHAQETESPPGQSSRPHIQISFSTSHLAAVQPSSPRPASGSSSPPHCTLSDTGPERSPISAETYPCSASVADVHTSHSPVSPAGQASPAHVVVAHSGPVQTKTSSLASTTHSSPAHAAFASVSPPHSPAPDTESSTSLTGASLSPTSPDVDTVALSGGAQPDIGADEPADCVKQTSPAASVPDDSAAVSPSQTSQNQVSQSPAGTAVIPKENHQCTASPSSLYQSPLIPTDATYTQASLSPASPVHASPTQDNTAMPSSTSPSEAPLSPTCPAPSQIDPGFKQITTSPGPMSPVQAEPGPGPKSPVQAEPGPCPESPVQAEPGVRPASASPFHCEASPACDSVNPAPSITSASPGPASPVKPEQGPGPEGMSDGTMDTLSTEEQQKKTDEEQQEEQPEHTSQESLAEEKPVERSEGGEEQNLKGLPSCSSCPKGVQETQCPASPIPTQQPVSFPLPSSPPSVGASSLEVSPHCHSQPTVVEGLPQEEKPPSDFGTMVGQKDQSPLCHMTSECDGGQSQSLYEPVALVTEPTKDEHQSQAEPSQEEEEEELSETVQPSDGQPITEEHSDMEEEPVSPVLDLDPSLDREVMELMTSSPPPSLLHLSSPSSSPLLHRGKGRTLRPPPCCPRLSDDLSIRLRQSPFSTEASPETSPARVPITPPPLTPPSPSLRTSPPARECPPLSKAPPTTVLPLTPKIGMGKPAISKRKFSPGRARVKQGTCWSSRRAVSPLSSSQDSTGEGGWDSPKPRLQDSPLWSMRVGRGSGFPGRRRSRGGGIGGRGGRGRSRLKTQDSVTVSPGAGYVEVFTAKEDEDNSMHNTVVMFSTSDHFTLRQDMCVVCGSFGQGAEGRLLACSQCGQCYHPYCVNVKITRVILTKGWRCLECTVCEACGEASDPGRLLLCDDCDISYHTYCLDPPLLTVPKGAWKCKWCVWCVQCGSASPGLRCEWQSNYSLCGPCCSLSRCPVCQRAYLQDDLILQCQQCDRWVHAVCQGLTTEEDVEVAADEGFDCSLCRTHGRSPYGRTESLAPFMAQIVSRIREPDSKTYTQDGVCLTESGLSHLQSLVEPLTSPRRWRRCKPKLKLRIINQNSVSVLQTPVDADPAEPDHGRALLDCEMKSDSSPERDHVQDDDITKEPDVADSNKKKKRKPYRPGIGGFMVRQRGAKAGAGPSRIKLCRKDSTEMLPGRDEDVAMEMAPTITDQTSEKSKKRYRKKKTKLEETFPSYLQEAFFGRDLLDRSRQVDRGVGPEAAAISQSRPATGNLKGPTPGFQAPPLSGASRKAAALPGSDGGLVDLSDVLNTDPHILATGHPGQFQVECSPSPFAGLDISSVADDASLTSEPTGSGGRVQRAMQEEPLDAILSPELDKMVTDGAILSKLYKIPELEGKDVEEVFTAVLSPDSSNSQSEQSQHTHAAAGSKTHNTGAAPFPRLPLMNGLSPAAPPMMPGVQGPVSFRVLPTENPAPIQGPTSALVPANQQGPAGEGEQDVLSTAQRSTLKWEKEESLGEMATVAPVLYCNTNFPQLKQQYPDWPTRVKQITKLWRKASAQDRAPYVQKARDNRAAQRINKVQLSNDPLKRHPPSQQQLPAPLGPFDTVSMEMEMPFKDPLRPKESEQEQEWKFRQGGVKDRGGASKKRQEIPPQSKKSPTDTDCPCQASVAAPQMRQKSKQLAKMEATQKLEQVKNEQRQQQQLLASQRLSGPQSPETGSYSPVPPGGSASPQLHPGLREGQPRQHLLQGSSGPADDVFLRPQAPPPSGFSSLPQSPHPTSPLYQPPSSPQMFSPPSSRPSSPWDPYNKVIGTPRPSSSQPGGPAASQQQHHSSLSTSPAHDVVGSPAPSPDSKTPDVSRSLGPQPGNPTPDPSVRHAGIRVAEVYQRTNVRVPAPESCSRQLVQGVVFKAPMPPQQEAFGGGGRRDLSRLTDPGFAPPPSQEPPFPSSPLSGLGSPHRSPYAQAPGTPRPDYAQQISDPFTQQSPRTSRPSPDPYTNPQTPGTPRPHSDPTYLTTPPALRPDQYNQQSMSCRPSPSHPTLDPYASNPGTPRPAVTDRFPRSPGSQRTGDPYAQPTGTPRPSLDPYAQQPSTPRPQKAHEPFSQTPVESLAAQPAASVSSPLAPGDPGTFTPTPHQLQQSPGRQQQQDSFPRTPSSHTSKHPGMSEESGFSALASHTPGHDPFEQGHMTPGLSQTDKMATTEISPLDGPMSVMPQLGDSGEKLRQRQRLRELILRQQQQKSTLRQEKGLQEPAPGLAAPPAAPTGSSAGSNSWSQEDSSSSNSTTSPVQTDPFGRPPPPYPGTIRSAGAPALRFPGVFPREQQRGFAPIEASFPRQSLPRELGVRGPGLRFGAPAGLHETFLRAPLGSTPASGLGAVEVPVQMRRPVPGDFTAIRPHGTPNPHPHMMQGVPQPFLPRSLSIQQHSIMGQPYIELRHRTPENRLRLPFSLPSATEPEAPLLHPRDPHPPAIRSGPGTRMGETLMAQQMITAGAVEQLNQQGPQQQHLGHTAALTQPGEPALSGADGIEEHLEGEDSAVKDLEDVEVKDLVDLNLNLDPEDGKEDLDLGPNDLHLDDFLLSGKFDLIAYADPELNLEDKKDMFNEELDLGEPAEEKESGERKDGVGGSRKTDSSSHLVGQIKQEVRDDSKTEVAPPGVIATSKPLGALGLEVSSVHHIKEKLEDSGSVSGPLSSLQPQEQVPSMGMVSRVQPPVTTGQQPVFQQQQRPFGPPSSSPQLTPHPQAVSVSPHTSLPAQDPQGPPHPLPLQPPHLLTTQTQSPHMGTSTQSQTQGTFAQTQVQNQNKQRPLLLEEQPLLLQDLLDQERQEQQQQKQMQALIRQRSTTDSAFPGVDFDSITDPIMKAKMVALKGINKVMSQGNLGLNPMVINRFQQPPGAPGPEVPPQPPHLVGQEGKVNPQLVRPTPPSFGPGFSNEPKRPQYEDWLGETQQLLQMQQRLLEDQIAAHRKTKKALSAKQRTAKKAGRVFAEEDAAQLRYISEQQGVVQKQLEQIRKQQKDHAELIEDYRTKHPQRGLQQQPAPSLPQKLLSQPIVPLQPHPGGPAPAHLPNVPPAWTPGGGAPGVMGQRMPPHLPLQLPAGLPNTPQVPPHTQAPSAMVPGLAAQTAGFTAASRGPAGGPNGATVDGAGPAPQVKFDDNNPFSEGFQERERRERLREQQERQRVQLMQEVERHRVLQQRLELEQQSLLGASVPPAATKLGPQVGPTAGPGPAPGVDGLSQMPFFSAELPQDFLQSPQTSRPRPQHQSQVEAPFPLQAGLRQGFTARLLLPGASPVPTGEPPMNVAPSSLLTRPRLPGLTGPSAPGQAHPAGVGAAGMPSSHPAGQGHLFGHDSSSSSPSTPLATSFPCSSSGGPASLIQLYSDVIPDDKPNKKRSRKKDGEEATGGGGARTPLSSQSDDLTAPPTPAVSDTACSTPTFGSMDQSELSFPQSSSLSGLAPSSELERQLSIISAAQQRAGLGSECQRGPLSAARLEVKEEREEGRACGAGVVKMEEGGAEPFSPTSPHQGGDAGKELLRHLLRDKTSPANTPLPITQAPPIARRQLSSDGCRSEEEDVPGSHGNMVATDGPASELLDTFGRKKTQRCKRSARPDKDRAPPKYKRKKKEEEEKALQSRSTSPSSDPVVTHLRQLAVLPLMEPVLGVDLGLFPPFGSSSLGRDSRLSGSFGNACLDGVTDYYSQLIYKQNNLSNPPTPPASLPPTPPPVARQKLVNGFATTEELTRKELGEQDVKGVSVLKLKGEELLSLNHPSKTVDVPASLPTPPHNNQEELRVQDSSERDEPDSYVPSSSPESVADIEVSRYPDLSFIKLEPPSPCPSPTLPMIPCAWGKGSAVKQEVKTEINHQGLPSCSNTDLVTIAITLNPTAAQNVPGVMAAVAELLQVPVPVNYQLSRASGPEQSSLALLASVQVPLTQGSTTTKQRAAATGNTGVRMDFSQQGGAATTRPQCCSYCKVLLGNGVRIVRELKQEGQSGPGSSLLFCSPNCSTLYTSDLQTRSAGTKSAVPVLLSGSECPPSTRVQHQYTNNMSSIAVHSLPRAPSSPPPTSSSSPPLFFPSASAITMETRPRMDSLKVKVKLKPRPRAVPGGEDSLSSRHGKRMKSSRWRRWSVNITLSRGTCISNEAVALPTEEEVDELLKNLGACLRPDTLPRDQRRCCFCHQQGDGQTDGPARLLNLDLDLWVHLNCALWSSEVYETQAGALINVELALRRGLTVRCAHCQQTGATSGCNRLRCTNTYHFTCALQAQCTFFKDKTMLCHLHKPRMVPLSGDRSCGGSPSSTPGSAPDPAAVAASDPYDSELRCFAVFRRVFVQRDEARQIAAVVQRGERQHTFRVGNLLFRAVGRLLPQQMRTFHNETAIFPVGYHANRIYWSMRHSNRRCKYMCYIEEEEGQPLFKVKVVEKGHDDLILTGPTPKAVWDQILDPVSQMRTSSGTLKLFPVYLKGEDLFGLTTSAVTRIIESLPGVEACERYTFRYGRNPLMEWPLAFNPSGSARSEPKACQAKRPYLLTSIAPRCQGSVGSIVGLVPGVISLSPGESVAGAHQGRHSKSSQYRRMKAEWKSNVYLARSRIQGLGLYAARDIEKCTMVIEYIGTIIRSEVANRKERLYESQNRGVYMFRIDNDYVIDATITGGPARYINHSCAPNCITEVVTVEKENKIIISSCRRIQRGEELCYDYKFDLEDDQHKIPCHCGAVNCRKWMN
ncbi:histone-lysine N-methyltransferase 2C isoform X5 [Oreochromis aureus]|uniref:histone-lysine N-methyltransferase 2C isoform X5 n=1 Tax=Oreochromis aureus TaxID=47969 RepID=UPI001953B125|nr:histone-lysine N-methyltransferase 2C isoform X5 [Oreochromis aureus]